MLTQNRETQTGTKAKCLFPGNITGVRGPLQSLTILSPPFINVSTILIPRAMSPRNSNGCSSMELHMYLTWLYFSAVLVICQFHPDSLPSYEYSHPFCSAVVGSLGYLRLEAAMNNEWFRECSADVLQLSFEHT